MQAVLSQTGQAQIQTTVDEVGNLAMDNGYSTETLVRQKAKGLSLDALLGTKMSTLLKSVLEVANTPALSQQRANWVMGMGTPLVHLPS